MLTMSLRCLVLGTLVASISSTSIVVDDTTVTRTLVYTEHPNTSLFVDCLTEEQKCLNNGICVGDELSRHCQCTTLYGGPRCETPNVCLQHGYVQGPNTDIQLLCENGGVCNVRHEHISSAGDALNLVVIAVPYCECDVESGFGGAFCNETSTEGTEHQDAPPEADLSEEDLPEAQCHHIHGGGDCMCDIHWNGHICDVCGVTCVSPEQSVPCHLELRFNSHGDAIGYAPLCRCHPGFAGPTCEETCDDFDCGNGSCKIQRKPLSLATERKCECNQGWGGELCDQCQLFNCIENGGSCHPDANGNAYCSCPDGREGNDCLTCPLQNSCLNDSICSIVHDTPLTMKEHCECLPGFAGKSCEESLPEDCQLECNNGGKCVLAKGFDPHSDSAMDPDFHVCECAIGWSGPFCETPSYKCSHNSDMHCDNGGVCKVADVWGKIVLSCDCEYATFNGKRWQGDHCEIEVTENDLSSTSTNSSKKSAAPYLIVGFSVATFTCFAIAVAFHRYKGNHIMNIDSLPNDLKVFPTGKAVNVKDSKGPILYLQQNDTEII